jgi:hypothetical protein
LRSDVHVDVSGFICNACALFIMDMHHAFRSSEQTFASRASFCCFNMAKLCFVDMAANVEESTLQTMIRWVASGEGPHELPWIENFHGEPVCYLNSSSSHVFKDGPVHIFQRRSCSHQWSQGHCWKQHVVGPQHPEYSSF